MSNTFEELENFEKSLKEKYPQLFDGNDCGIGTGKGWWPLVDTLCATIQSHMKNSKDCPPVTICQVKEKFGGLRFYINGGDDFIHGAIWLAESISMVTCEVCGAPGKQQSPRGWIKTLCNEHAIRKEEE